MGGSTAGATTAGVIGGNYLQTIESEEAMGTEGYENNSVLSSSHHTALQEGINSSALVTQNNLDDAF